MVPEPLFPQQILIFFFLGGSEEEDGEDGKLAMKVTGSNPALRPSHITSPKKKKEKKGRHPLK